MDCCGGKGLFFFVRECVVFVMKHVSGNAVVGNFNSSIYFDKYGEEDIGMFGFSWKL